MKSLVLYLAILTLSISSGCKGNGTTVQSSDEIQKTHIQIIDIPNARTPLPNVLSGGQPTPKQLEQARDAGYKTVINLRTANENSIWDEASKAAELGMNYINIPVAGKSGLSIENATALMEAIQKHSDHPIMVHCGSGNRVGALFAIDAKFNKNQTTEEAIATGIKAGLTSLKPAVEEYLKMN